ncbi:hypothetical protein BLNAU_8548 [Blattamonas nauphoetae]|uniref:B30.2/SPRY domain-containing protein n=1 Tax=Blattamonas nauphoetae TaxID=2049346 RepID=A0ABQ9XYG5_9EUKA|nr:hypothetical protein BLNAU_8548 [Blattamonas nauphoetae]
MSQPSNEPEQTNRLNNVETQSFEVDEDQWKELEEMMNEFEDPDERAKRAKLEIELLSNMPVVLGGGGRKTWAFRTQSWARAEILPLPAHPFILSDPSRFRVDSNVITFLGDENDIFNLSQSASAILHDIFLSGAFLFTITIQSCSNSLGVFYVGLVDSTTPLPQEKQNLGCDVKNSIGLHKFGSLHYNTPSSNTYEYCHSSLKEGDCIQMEVDLFSTPRTVQFFVNGVYGEHYLSGIPSSVRIGFSGWGPGTSFRIDEIARLSRPSLGGQCVDNAQTKSRVKDTIKNLNLVPYVYILVEACTLKSILYYAVIFGLLFANIVFVHETEWKVGAYLGIGMIEAIVIKIVIEQLSIDKVKSELKDDNVDLFAKFWAECLALINPKIKEKEGENNNEALIQLLIKIGACLAFALVAAILPNFFFAMLLYFVAAALPWVFKYGLHIKAKEYYEKNIKPKIEEKKKESEAKRSEAPPKEDKPAE